MEVQVRVKFVVDLVRWRLVTLGAAVNTMTNGSNIDYDDKYYTKCNNIALHTIGLY